MRLTKNHIDMLYRVALAEFWTSPAERARYNRHDAIADLHKGELIQREGDCGGSWRLTKRGLEVLDQRLTGDRAELLAKLRENRARRVAP